MKKRINYFPKGIKYEKVILTGDSAGGNLALGKERFDKIFLNDIFSIDIEVD